MWKIKFAGKDLLDMRSFSTREEAEDGRLNRAWVKNQRSSLYEVYRVQDPREVSPELGEFCY